MLQRNGVCGTKILSEVRVLAASKKQSLSFGTHHHPSTVMLTGALGGAPQ
jgi:hypothetical protein